MNIGRYEIKGELGRGGMGVVYRAFDPELHREVAIKQLQFPAALPEQDLMVLKERFFREARAACRLSHPNIVTVHDVVREGETGCIVMELIRGKSLAEELPKDFPSVIRILREVASALDSAHQTGMVHRDIKPGNILLDQNGRAKVADFGVAKVDDSRTMTKIGMTVGTLGYMCPEQIKGEKVDGRADQFSLAVVAYELLTRKLPFDGESWITLSYRILNDNPKPPRAANAAVAEHTSNAILKALSKTPGDRFPTCIAFVEALAGEVHVPASASGSGMKIAGATAAVVLLGLGAMWFANRNSGSKQPPPPPPANTVATQPAPEAPKPNAPKPSEPERTAAKAFDAEALTLETNGVRFDFAKIPAGQFFMGDDAGRDDEKPRHMVSFAKPFQMGKTEVTRKQWSSVMGSAAPAKAAESLPVIQVSWLDTQAFLSRLNALNDGFQYRLPTEAEWEYAARAGAREDNLRELDDVAWQANNSGYAVHPVGTRMANSFGLLDMRGNVWEWCSDWYGDTYYGESAKTDPKGPATGTLRVARGGGASTQGMMLDFAFRTGRQPSEKNEEVGLRLVRQPAK